MAGEVLEKRIEALESQNRRLHVAMSGVLLAFCLSAGLWNVSQTLNIERFSEIFDQMLDGKALPGLTTFVIRAQFALLAVAVLLMVAACVTFFTLGRRSLGIWLLLAILFAAGAQILVVRQALWRPLVSIVSDMSSG